MRDSRISNRSNRIWGKRRIYRKPHPVVVESRTNSLFGQFPRGENRGLIPHAIGKTVVALAPTGPIYLSLMCEGKVEWQNDTNSDKSIALRTSGGSFGRNYVL